MSDQEREGGKQGKEYEKISDIDTLIAAFQELGIEIKNNPQSPAMESIFKWINFERATADGSIGLTIEGKKYGGTVSNGRTIRGKFSGRFGERIFQFKSFISVEERDGEVIEYETEILSMRLPNAQSIIFDICPTQFLLVEGGAPIESTVVRLFEDCAVQTDLRDRHFRPLGVIEEGVERNEQRKRLL